MGNGIELKGQEHDTRERSDAAGAHTVPIGLLLLAQLRLLMLPLAALIAVTAGTAACAEAQNKAMAAASESAASAPTPSSALRNYRFPNRVIAPTNDAFASVWYAYRSDNGRPLLASDGLPEPFVISVGQSYAVGVFSGKRLVETGKKLPRGQYPSVVAAARVSGSQTKVQLRHCCEGPPGGVTPREAYSDAEWQGVRDLREALQLFAAEERGKPDLVHDCAGVEWPIGSFGMEKPSLVLSWRLVYVVNERIEATRCNGYFNVFSLGGVGDPLGDGSRIAWVRHQDLRSYLIFRVDEQTGLPVGALPAWVKPVGVDDLIAFRARFRAEQHVFALTAEQRTGRLLHCGEDEDRNECRRLVDDYQRKLLEFIFQSKTPRLPR